LDAVRRCWKLSRIGCTAGNLPRPRRSRRRPARRAACAGSRRDTADDVEFQGTAPLGRTPPCSGRASAWTITGAEAPPPVMSPRAAVPILS
jgi:hypothetical protein